jgi:hypothetical protein
VSLISKIGLIEGATVARQVSSAANVFASSPIELMQRGCAIKEKTEDESMDG